MNFEFLIFNGVVVIPEWCCRGSNNSRFPLIRQAHHHPELAEGQKIAGMTPESQKRHSERRSREESQKILRFAQDDDNRWQFNSKFIIKN